MEMAHRMTRFHLSRVNFRQAIHYLTGKCFRNELGHVFRVRGKRKSGKKKEHKD